MEPNINPMASWQNYLQRLFTSVALPPEKHDEDVIVGTAHGIDADGKVMTSPVVRKPNGVYETTEPMYAVYRFRLPGR